MKILLSNHIILLEVGFYVAPEALLSFKIVSSVIPVVVLDQREKKHTWHDLVHFKAKVVFKPEDFNLHGEQAPLSLC